MSLIHSPITILTRILEVLAENSCIMRDVELYNTLRKEFDISYADLLRYLMVLEIRGYIHVSSSRDNVRIIRISNFGKEQLRINSC